MDVHVHMRVWWCIPVISGLEKVRQENPEFEASLNYIVTSRPGWPWANWVTCTLLITVL
jgi:hypothetical protein